MTEPNGPRLALAGNQWISRYLLERLIEAGHAPRLVLNVPPDRSAGISGYEDLGPFCEAERIELYRPAGYGLKTKADRTALGARRIDALLVFGWGRLIPPWLIARCRLGVYGVHGGPKPPPRCRGRAVFNWALLLGCERFYLYLFRIDPGVDSGRIIETVRFDITAHDDCLSLYHKNCVVAGRLILHHLPAILDGTVRAAEQPAGEPSYLPKRTPEHGGIRWDAPARRIANLIRAVAPPYPGAFSFLDGVKLELHAAHVFDTQIRYDAPPGEIIEVFPGGHFVVATGDWPLYVRAYRCEDPSAIRRGRRFQLHSGESVPDPQL
jgi:methionyl-tRNA formyltransferase